jgi:micrococcal nuclease
VKAASIGAISAAVAVAVFILVFVGIGSNQQAEQPTDYKKLLEDGIASKSIQTSPGEQKDYQKTLEESVSSKSTSQESNCDPSYPTVCIATYPPDLNCKDIPYSNFQVFPPDPHGFDADSDGVGCEK